jgi:hypothetical protein
VRAAAEVLIVEMAKLVSVVSALDELRQNEGSCVTVMNDNPEFCPEEQTSAIEVVDAWTCWTPMRFLGRNVGEALAAALAEKQRRESENEETKV